MLFTLEALDARQGDALLLHFGETRQPRLVLIDGGPGSSTWNERLRARLAKIRSAVTPSPADALVLDLLMVSHIDDDHIGGVLAMTRVMQEAREEQTPAPFDILGLWHNAFEDLVGDPAAPAALAAAAGRPASASSASIAAGLSGTGKGAAVVASIDQGRRLRDDARALALRVNAGFRGPVRRLTRGPRTIDMGAGLEIQVIGPSNRRLNELQAEWNEVLAKRPSVDPATFRARVAAFTDSSVANLASIIVIAKANGHTMLLTGDARGDDILEALEESDLLAGGRVHFDIFKVPHHGSEHNVTTAFFEAVTADHYVISANGRHGNPDPAMLEMLVAARGQAEYEIHLTNRVDDAVSLLSARKRSHRFATDIRRRDLPSVRIELDEPLPRGMLPSRITS